MKKDKKYERIFLLDCMERDLILNKRVLKMMDLAERVLTFKTANEALLSLMKPGRVPELLLVGKQMADADIKNFMQRFACLPKWVTDNCKVCLLLPPLDIKNDEDEYFHPLIYKTIRKPFCVFEFTEDENLVEELSA